MRILILGGTVFLSRRIAERALELGHEVTCLARGSVSMPPPGANLVQADRDGATPYAGVERDWDVVVEVSWQPHQVEDALRSLGARAGLWIYVSSCSVYADNSAPGADESAPLLPAYDGDTPAPGESYGEAKVACEELCHRYRRNGALIARPGLICGPGDPSDRFGYWPGRLARGGTVIVPAIRDRWTQTIDVDDLAGWLLTAAARGLTGVFNTVGPSTGFGDLIDRTVSVVGFEAALRWVEPGWLLEHGVAYWAGTDSLPHWLPEGYDGFASRSGEAALAEGLSQRSVEETIQRVLEDERRRGLDRERKSGLTAGTEERLLAELPDT
ncbi:MULTISPECIES: NAD-dependent epimerase/dehydratase family protein [unclassified Arthrobacter]|uniref:NAD-dependent epimerase/dehydratase family protein n=1 Tax=unclassified Arthrobacter TaxID=235627 RepID=UPI00149318AD|nr:MULTISPECIES: NAD-dependent epimerase/dehydratase family protein [unclassified Arthrobacter]MBE0010210.1 NAD-dependent epimerase/dehydratase family protein [Arthrobacter sp. AET 35A]NOJ64026.1 NAD-dependent epimerase/dehydratase family protein [Arthrobacter sp. 147(2020)]